MIPKSVPIEYPDDPSMQAAFERVYKDRLWMLRVREEPTSEGPTRVRRDQWLWADAHYQRIKLVWNSARTPAVSLDDLHERFSGKCYYCGRDTVLYRKGDLMATRDHFVPKSKGGKDHADNIVLACAACNTEKGSQFPYRRRCS